MEKHITVDIQASYEVLNEFTSKTKRIWLVFHGYGMLSKYFIRKFEILDAQENFIIAPQGLSKFYLKEHSGRIGASWMTREDRITEIQNQQVLISSILEKEAPDFQDLEIIVLGFSQGAATACRFLVNSQLPFDQLILWSGAFPEDIDVASTREWIGKKSISAYYGDDDHFITPEVIASQKSILNEKHGLEFEVHQFKGGHLVVPELLLEI